MLNSNNSSGIFYNKSKLLALIASIIISLSVIPFILPHISHVHMIYHILLHIASLIISQFLAVVSILTYLKTKSTKILFMTLGFTTLVVVEYFYLLNSTEDLYLMIIPIINIDVSQIIMLIMVIFFGVSFLKNLQ
ncbi:MAG: hypothetical protein AB7P56_03830 [Nitrososphaeraceae archaeon]